MMNDPVKVLYRSSQDILTRSGCDLRNSIMRVIDFYDKITEVFNDSLFKSQSQALPDLHSDFLESRQLLLGEYKLTREKAKKISVHIRPKLGVMINKYELIGAGSGQRDEDHDDYGKVDLTKCVDGDDCSNFISSPNESYLLYWWNKLDQEGFVQFTLCVLDKFQRANTTKFNLVSNIHLIPTKRSTGNQDDENKKKRAINMGLVGEGIKTMSYITIEREIENWEERLYKMEDKLVDYEDASEYSCKMIDNTKKRMRDLEDKISNQKRLREKLMDSSKNE